MLLPLTTSYLRQRNILFNKQTVVEKYLKKKLFRKKFISRAGGSIRQSFCDTKPYLGLAINSYVEKSRVMHNDLVSRMEVQYINY